MTRYEILIVLILVIRVQGLEKNAVERDAVAVETGLNTVVVTENRKYFNCIRH